MAGYFYTYNVLPFGLRNAPYAFAKTVPVLVARWRHTGIKVIPYLDDFLFSGHLKEAVIHMAPLLEVDLLRATFCVNLEKSTTNPTRDIRHHGFYG
jgi:hypothetical protein